MKIHWPLFPAALLVAFSTLSSDPAGAVPAFAQQCKTECKTCHTIIPERNEFGDAFEKNSFIWPSESLARKPESAEKESGVKDALATAGPRFPLWGRMISAAMATVVKPL